jgi:hypothetical protein
MQTMQDGTKSAMLNLLRWLIATALVLFGSFLYLGSALVGSAIHLEPNPEVGMLLAGLALVFAIGGYWLIRGEKRAGTLATIINVVLIYGAISLVYALLLWGYETIYRVQPSEWGHSRPGDVIFRVSYGFLSLTGLALFNRWVQKTNVPGQ